MKRIVRGNDFSIVIPMVRIDGETRGGLDLTQCTGVTVRLCSAYRRIVLEHTVGGEDNATITARVEGDSLPLGTYAVEVTGRINGNDWRTYDCGAVQLVDCNHDADSDLGDTIDMERVEMEAASVTAAAPLFSPRGAWTDGTQYHTGDIVSYGTQSWYAAQDTDTEPSPDNDAWVILCDGAGIRSAQVERNRLVITI